MNTASSTAQNGTLPAKAYQRRATAPSVDVFENSDELLLVADVPGVPNDGIELQFDHDTLTLTARRPSAPDDAPAVAREWEPTDFVATFRIPAGIDASAITAETKHGTLVVRLPKAAASKARKIVVRSGSGG